MPRLLIFLLLVFLTPGASAQDEHQVARPDLYAGEILVEGKSAAERNDAIPSALIHVLQKLSGRRELDPGPGLEQALAAAEDMLLAYYYEERRRLMPDGTEVEETWLVARFVPAAVDAAARDLALPRWRPERPPLTVWIAVDDGTGRRLMPLEYAYAWDAMQWVASQRGLPIGFPEVDPMAGLDAELQLVWGGFTESLPRPDGVSGGLVTIAARRAGAEWQLRWTYDNGIETMGWRGRDTDLSLALTQGVHLLTDLVADRDSIRGFGQGSWQVSLLVDGIVGSDDYSRCLDYLEKLGVVDRLAVESASPGSIGFRLALNAEPRYLDEVLLRDGVLQPGTTSGRYRLSR